MKIFQIGFNKCGTYSIYHLFAYHTTNNLKCIHWNKGKIAQTIKNNILINRSNILGQYSNYDVITDMEHATDKEIILAHKDYFKDLDRCYPNSKFILNIRPIDKWIKSRMYHEIEFDINYVDKYKTNFHLTTTLDVISLWKQHWYEHIENVKTYFRNRQHDLLVFDIENSDMQMLKNFLPTINFTTNILPKKHVT